MGAAELDALIAQLRKLPHAVDEALPEAAKELETIIAGNIEAQRGPDGVPWPRPADRTVSVVLRNAMKNITVRAIERVLLARVVGVEAKHHLGAIRGRVKRELIPTGKAPQPMIEAIKRVVFKRLGAVSNGND